MRKILSYLSLLFLLVVMSCQSKDHESNNQTYLRPVSISILHDQDSDVSEWLKSSSEEFLNIIGSEIKGVRVSFSFIGRESNEALNNLADGKEKADAILVPHPEFANLASAKTKGLGATISSCKNIISSPIVAILPRTQAPELSSRLGRLINESESDEIHLTMNEISKVISNSRYSQRHPLQSAEGKLSLLFSISSFSEKARMDSFKLPESDKERLQQNLQWYSSSNLDLLEHIASGNTSSEVAAKKLFEVALLSKRHLSVSAEAREKVIALQPSDFSLLEVQSLCISDADWVSPLKRSIIARLQEHLRSPTSIEKAKLRGFGGFTSESQGESTIKAVGTSADIKASMLTTEFTKEYLKPYSLSLAIDTSSSIGVESLAHLREFTMKLYDSKPYNLDILRFSSEVEVIGDLGTARQTIQEQLTNLSPSGGSSVYDALAKQLELLASRANSKSRQSVLLVTDGNDKTSLIAVDELIKLITDYKANHGMLSLSIILLSPSGADAEPLQKISKAANGKIYPIEPAKLALLLATIESSL